MLKKIFKFYPPALAYFLSRVPAETLESRGIQFALQTARQAFARVPAYQKFLSEHQVDPGVLNSIDGFKTLPLMGKENYLHKYSIGELCLDGTLRDKYLIDGSSGYSGKRSFWPRLADEDKDFPTYMELTYRQFYRIHQRSTLMIITLGLGTWIAGEKISWATRQVAIKGKNRLTVMTPGMQLEEIIDIVKQLGPLYEQVVIISYPLYARRIINEGAKKGIDWAKINVKLGVGGEVYSQGWRDYMAEKIGLPESDLMGISSTYGAADLGMSVGRETPLTVLLRKLAYKDQGLAEDLFGEWNPLPSFCQYNPMSFFIEKIEEELVFTANPAIPVVRYNIHDRGGVISFNKVLAVVSDHGYNPLKMLTDYGYQKNDVWHLPFFYVWGRSGKAGSVSIFGLIIYTESIKVALDQPSISTWTTGNFLMEVISDQEHNPFLQIKIELASGLEPKEEIEKEFVQVITTVLEEQNSEYRELRLTMKDKVLPHIKLFRYQDKEVFDPNRIKSRYTSPS